MKKTIPLVILFFLFPTYPNIVFAEDKNSEIEIVLRQGHFSDVKPVAFSPDGEIMVSASSDSTLKLWDTKTNRLLKTIESGIIKSIIFSPTENIFASGNYDGSIKIWDVKTGKLLKIFKNDKRSTSKIAFSPNGQIIAATVSYKKEIELWDVKTGKLLKLLKGHEKNAYLVGFLPDGENLISTDIDDFVKTWELETGNMSQLFPKNQKANSFSFSPTGTLALGYDDSVTLFNTNTGMYIDRINLDHAVNSVSFSSNGKKLAWLMSDKYPNRIQPADLGKLSSLEKIQLWNVEKHELSKVLKGNRTTIKTFSFSPDGRTLASGGKDQTIKIWNTETGTLKNNLNKQVSMVTSAAFSPDGKILAVGDSDKNIRLWDIQTGELLKILKEHRQYITSVAFSPINKVLASADTDRRVRIWDIETGKRLKTLTTHHSVVRSVSFSADGKKLTSDGIFDLELWDVKTGKRFRTFKKPKGNGPFSSSVSRDHKVIALGDRKGNIQVWDIETNKKLRTIITHQGVIFALSFSPDSKIMASEGGDKTIKLWNAKTGELLKTLSCYNDGISLLSFSPNSQTLASLDQKKFIKLWNVSTGELLKTLNSKQGRPLIFSPNGKTIAKGNYNGNVELWDIKTGKKKLILATFPNNEWITYQPGKNVYVSSPKGDEYAVVRFGKSLLPVYPLKNYRKESKRNNIWEALNGLQPDWQPKPIN
jgi:WD40 repeat protein